MKLILSRKGFDSSSGGVPSPIFPDGRIVSLPIPDENSPVTYGGITCDGTSLGNLVCRLTGGRITAEHRAHLDPDLVQPSLPRLPDWRPIFGQTGQAQGHLRNSGVGPGDLFLFFGLFRRVELRGGSFDWVPDARPRHVIWGWLEVAEVLHIGNSIPCGYSWASFHPHFNGDRGPNNTVYLASSELHGGNSADALPGAGIFNLFDSRQQLTACRSNKLSVWDLPGWFYPDRNRTPLSYHSDMNRWRKDGDRTALQSVARGQEFVLDCDEYPEALPWACDLISKFY